MAIVNVGYPSDDELVRRALQKCYPEASFKSEPPTVEELGYAFDYAMSQGWEATAKVLLKAVPLPSISSLLKR